MKNKNVDVKVTKKVVDAEEVKGEYEEPIFVEVKRDGIKQYWKSLSFKKKLGLILGTFGAAAGAAAGGYFFGRSITKAETAKTLELPSDVIIENEVSNDEVE